MVYRPYYGRIEHSQLSACGYALPIHRPNAFNHMKRVQELNTCNRGDGNAVGLTANYQLEVNDSCSEVSISDRLYGIP